MHYLADVHCNLTCLAWSLLVVSQTHLHLLDGVVQVLHHAACQLLGQRFVLHVASSQRPHGHEAGPEKAAAAVKQPWHSLMQLSCSAPVIHQVV